MELTLSELRQSYAPPLPLLLKKVRNIALKEGKKSHIDHKIEKQFPHLHAHPLLYFIEGAGGIIRPLRVGVLFSGGQASGGHNVVVALFDALQQIHPESKLLGFLDGPIGLLENHTKELSASLLHRYRNQGGFDLIGSGRTKIASDEQFLQAGKVVKELCLDGLVIVGGDDSNTNAVFLAEYFIKK